MCSVTLPSPPTLLAIPSQSPHHSHSNRFITYDFIDLRVYRYLGDSDPIIILANASICFQNAKKFLSEIRRIEIENENTEKLKNVKIGGDEDGTKTLDSGPWTSDSMRVADRQACACTMLLMKVTSCSTVRYCLPGVILYIFVVL